MGCVFRSEDEHAIAIGWMLCRPSQDIANQGPKSLEEAIRASIHVAVGQIGHQHRSIPPIPQPTPSSMVLAEHRLAAVGDQAAFVKSPTMRGAPTHLALPVL